MENTSDTEFRDISDADFNKLSSALTKAGYKDGIAEGRDAVFQSGFDTGYSDGFRTAFEIGKWSAMRGLVKQKEASIRVPSEHPILDAPEKEHHQFLKQQSNEPVDEISKRQKKYIAQITTTLNADLKEIKHFFE